VEAAKDRLDALTDAGQKAGAFPSRRRTDREDDQQWQQDGRLRRVAEVADSYPRLLAWLAEGQVSGYWNVFGTWIAVLRYIPGVRWLVWRYFFKPIAEYAPWRLALYEVILQAVRYELNMKCADQPGLRFGVSNSTEGLSAVTDIAMMTETAARGTLRAKIEKMSSGCIGVTGLRSVGKSTLIRDFCGHRYGTPMWAWEGQIELPGLRLKVQAPCRYGAREFRVHLYTCLCQAVLADMRLNPTSFFDRIVLSLFLPRVRDNHLRGDRIGQTGDVARRVVFQVQVGRKVDVDHLSALVTRYLMMRLCGGTVAGGSRRDRDDCDVARGRWYRFAGQSQALDVKLDGLAHLSFALFQAVAGHDHAGQIRCISAVVGRAVALDHDRVLTHDDLS
jgi:hypothetical protein